jgi:hypothetical protein
MYVFWEQTVVTPWGWLIGEPKHVGNFYQTVLEYFSVFITSAFSWWKTLSIHNVVWVTTPCDLVEGQQCLQWTYCLLLQEVIWIGGSMFFRNQSYFMCCRNAGRYNFIALRFGVPTAVLLKIRVFRDDMPSRWVSSSRCSAFTVRAKQSWPWRWKH